MSNCRDLSLEKYGISDMKYRELKYFCLQYEEKKQNINDTIGLHGANFSVTPKGKNINSPTEMQALRISKDYQDVKTIERIASEAGQGISQYILTSVTQGMPYEYMDVPCGRRQFYQARRMFFYLLSLER